MSETETGRAGRPELVLWGLSMVPIAFADLVRVAGAAGFDAVSVGAAIYRRAVRDGLSMADMRRILDDSGVLGVQLADADAEILGSLEEDVLHRRLPGRGHLALAQLIAQLDRQGVRAPIGIEVWDKELLAGGPQAAASELARSVREFLAPLESPSQS